MVTLYYLLAAVFGIVGAASFVLFARALAIDDGGTPQGRQLLFGLVLLGVAFKSYRKARAVRVTRALRRR